jgi:hypothetical protein
VGERYLRIPLDHTLTEPYVIDPLAPRGLLELNDGVACLSATTITPSDYFEAPMESIIASGAPSAHNPFVAAYTEYVAIAPSSVEPTPRTILFGGVRTTQFFYKWFRSLQPRPVPSTDPDARNWYSYPLPPGHQVLLIGDTNILPVTQSGSNGFTFGAGERFSVVNRSTIEQRSVDRDSPMFLWNNGNLEAMVRRTTTHEVMHQWGTNLAVFGASRTDHCHPEVAYDSTRGYPTNDALPPAGFYFCLMSNADEAPTTMEAPWNYKIQLNMVEYFYRFGWTSCHMTPNGAGWHSEYSVIRQAPDPWMP